MADPAGLTDDPGGDPIVPGPGADVTSAIRVLLAAQLAALAVLVLNVPALVVLAVLVAATVSGYALVRHARLADPLMEVLLSPAITLSLMGLLSVAQAYTGWWQPRVTVGAMLLLGTASATLELVRARSAAREAADAQAQRLVAARVALVARAEVSRVRTPAALPMPKVVPSAAVVPEDVPSAVVAETVVAQTVPARTVPPAAVVPPPPAEPTASAPAARKRAARKPAAKPAAGPEPAPEPTPHPAQEPAPPAHRPPACPRPSMMTPEPRSRTVEPATSAPPDPSVESPAATARPTRRPPRGSA
jgi:hypothetical protein